MDTGLIQPYSLHCWRIFQFRFSSHVISHPQTGKRKSKLLYDTVPSHPKTVKAVTHPFVSCVAVIKQTFKPVDGSSVDAVCLIRIKTSRWQRRLVLFYIFVWSWMFRCCCFLIDATFALHCRKLLEVGLVCPGLVEVTLNPNVSCASSDIWSLATVQVLSGTCLRFTLLSTFRF